ncbi:hypothetical protein GCM10009596_04470 [Arthrobacter rhombi]
MGPQLLLLPGAQVIALDDDGRALFQRRVDTGDWEFPGGGAEPGQDFRAVAVAELAEETGLAAAPSALIPFATLSDPVDHELEYPNGDRVHAFALCFVWPHAAGSLEAEASEVTELGFHRLDDPPQPMSRAAARVLGLYREYVRTGSFQAC